MTFFFQLPSLPQTTIVPENKDLFIPYLNRLYEDIAVTVNAKDDSFFTIPISSTPTNIPNVANFGAFLVTISGSTSGLPTYSASLCKSDANVAGIVTPIGSQAGTAGVWAGATLTITSTATNFQISHSVAGMTGNFNIRIISTQA